jgi:hypothetical protein
MVTSKRTPLSQDAALVAALAGTAMPFSRSAEEQADRWLRALRLHGQVGATLQGLGVGESALIGISAAGGPGTPPLEGDVLQRVVDRARESAVGRSGAMTCTADLLLGVLEVYGPLMDHALYLRGTSREELVERLAATGSPAEKGCASPAAGRPGRSRSGPPRAGAQAPPAGA